MKYKKYIIPILFILIEVFCSGGNSKSIIIQQSSKPSYFFGNQKEFTSPLKINTIQLPLNVSSESYLNFKNTVTNNDYPSFLYIEQFLNAFQYNLPINSDKNKLSLYTETANSPWSKNRKLLQVSIMGNSKIEKETNSLPKNLIFAIDVSGSMAEPNRMNLAKLALKRFVNNLNPKDFVSIITYSTEAETLIEPTEAQQKSILLNKIAGIRDTGGTNAWPGIQLAYRVAREMQFNKRQTKIVILSDGDFGGVNDEEFFSLVRKERFNNTTISILGFSTERKINTMDKLNDLKLGDSIYIDSIEDARLKLNDNWLQFSSIATDLKLEVKFDSKNVESFKLIGFDRYNPSKNKEIVDADSSFFYTALYEIIPSKESTPTGELAIFRLSYNTFNKTEELKRTAINSNHSIWDSSDSLRLAAGISALGMVVNDSVTSENIDFYTAIHLIQSTLIYDPDKSRQELLNLVIKLKNMK
ncbi:MAG TPA: von Willebrand factor type A domain-containing protein [Leptospiraceae bacterium]|nr:von Willebrand factor type A domain-containing protein [Leptospiraceae bacterium]HMX33752.1 von Willebrand factor type A domain-containing protein [Leptospiraceae bacterium]HMY32889.1 von Willebrand factor type A domain-containing protein [Leptospiraceae bacterium]HMZ65948.1 von Willebrand factor type A domain-containing protein [Leptospiraceae bacterium]HNA09957.1 von Willebrand factor type A domain-containing protein [Leptospiraceae bacterium]